MGAARSDLLSGEEEGRVPFRPMIARSIDTAAARRLFLRPLGSKSTRGGGNNTFWAPGSLDVSPSLPPSLPPSTLAHVRSPLPHSPHRRGRSRRNRLKCGRN